jgi:hypothetical protein
MSARLRQVNLAMIGAMRNCLLAGAEKGLWLVEDAAGAALRTSAIYDGIAGMLWAETADLTLAEAETHLRKAVGLELRRADEVVADAGPTVQ